VYCLAKEEHTFYSCVVGEQAIWEAKPMTVEEQEFVKQREEMLDDVLDYIATYEGPPLYQDAVVSALKDRFPEKMIVSGIWRLLEMHRIDLNNRLAIVLPRHS
jgi:hypothetical protein